MATLVFSALGSLIGGPLGGAIGVLAGRQITSMIFGGGTREGPRLKELAVTASSYGTTLPRHYGRMRVPGTVIWATDLVERKEKQSGGKGQPSVNSYTYSASFAVALASRPIRSVGRIWADGNLVRGVEDDLKVNGTFRLYTGKGDQMPDPLIAEIEGEANCPAWRGLAYAVFEDLELGDFFNRIPSLTFEVFADDGVLTVQTLLDDLITDTAAPLALDGIDGFTCESPLSDTLTLLEPMYPIDCDAGGDVMRFARGSQQSQPILLLEPAISVGDGDFGARSGFARKREPVAPTPPEVLRFYDIERQYQIGLQRATGRTGPGQPFTVELPAALTAANARVLAERMARHAGWARETLAWRTSDLDPAIAPGAIVAVPGQSGRWRVSDWEWRDSGVELSLIRLAPAVTDAASTVANLPADPGRANPPLDELAPPTVLAAMELPWDGSGNVDTPEIFAAVSSSGASWSGAALYVDHGDGSLLPLGSSGRGRSTMGSAVGALPPANPLLFDRTNTVTVQLLAEDMELTGATPRGLATGSNRALLGSEIIQFGNAVPLGNRIWRLEHLLRGRGGTETAIAGHVAGERFVLLDGQAVVLDSVLVGSSSNAEIAAVGLGDAAPVVSPIALPGITQRPLSPVHPKAATLPDGSLQLSWTRRARGAWVWVDGVDAPLREQAEAYLVSFGPIDTPEAIWEVTTPQITISASQKTALAAALPGEALRVRQRGTYALSDVLVLTHLP